VTADKTPSVNLDGPCPFLTCLAPGPHSHPICPECGAVRFGNLFCPTCRANREAAILVEQLEAAP
jgi:hypothetical protein